MAKTLVAYFSVSGVTAKVARKLAQAADAALYEIAPAQPYTQEDLDWTNRSSRSTLEMADRASRPEIAGGAEDLAAYDTVFVGFPIWWGREPSIVDTFLQSYDFSGKTVIPFATSGGSGLGQTEAGLRALCTPQTAWKSGRLLSGGCTAASLAQWIEELK